jgi:hypothetical protein
MYTSNQMTAALRAITSVGLSIWMSALACLIGCGQMLASPRASCEANSAPIASADMPSCHHLHSSTPCPEKKQDSRTVSCCLPDATAQKTTPGLNAQLIHALFSGAAIDTELRSRALSAHPADPLLHSGRQTILKNHLLRI